MSNIPPPPQTPQPAAPSPDAWTVLAEAKAAKAGSKALRPRYSKKVSVLLSLVAVINVAAVACGGGNDDDAKSSGSTVAVAGGEAANTGQDVYEVGQTAKSDVFEVTLDSIDYPSQPDIADVIPEGKRFISVRLEMTNTSSDRKTFSTLVGIEVTDAENQTWNITTARADLPTDLDGDYQPGQTKKGWATFAVPIESTGLKLRVKGSATAAGSLFAL